MVKHLHYSSSTSGTPTPIEREGSRQDGGNVFGSAVQDYTKAIYELGGDRKRVLPSALAESLGVTLPAVTKMVRRLTALRLASYVRAEGIELTPSGTKVALETLRHHRLIELYLKEALGYSWDQV